MSPRPQDEMADGLLAEIEESTSVLTFPMNSRIVIYPVVPDVDREIHVVTWGKELAEMGVVWYVSYGANAEQMELLRDLEREKALAEKEKSHKHAKILGQQLEAIQETGLIQRGDIVAVNKFSGMDIPETNFIAIHREDVLSKLVGLPVRLKKETDRPDDGFKEDIRAQAAEEAGAGTGIVGAKSIPGG